ncbi:MAG TPA: PaaI family thioesterase [Acidimicrobiales bacterium]|nr:PaaI family thioesterase [Acidimicrobiales bacterium]
MSDDESTDPGPGTGWASSIIKAEDPVALTPLRVEKRRLAASMRRVIDQLVSVDAPIDLVRDAADDLERVADRFSGQPPQGYEGFAEAANAPRHDSFVDHSPVLGRANPLAPPLELWFDDGRIVAEVTFGSAYEGPPGCVHGGWVAAAFDEVLGATQSLSGSGGMTAKLTVNYRKPTPLHELLRFEGELAGVEGRKIFTIGRLYHGELLTAEAEGLFISIDFARFAELRRRREQERS